MLEVPTIDVNSDIDVVLWPNRILLSVVGAWIMKKESSFAANIFRGFRVFLGVSFPASVVIASFFTIGLGWGDLDILTEIGCVGTQMLLLLSKYANLVIRRSKFTKIYESLRELWSQVQNQEERDSLVGYAYTAQVITCIFFVMCFADLVIFCLAPVFMTYLNYRQANGTDYYKLLPFDLFYGVDNQISPNYEVIFSIQLIHISFCTFSVSGTDGTYPALAFHVSGQFKLVQTRLASIGQKLNADSQSSSQSKATINVNNELRLCIKLHQKVLRLAKDVEEFMGPVIFMQLMLGALQICLTGYALIDGSSSAVSQCKYCIYMNSVLAQLYIYCWPGEAVITESTAVGDYAYNSVPWTMLTPERRRDLSLLCNRSQRQCQISALGVQVACMTKVTEVVKAAGSYMAVLRTMRDK